MQNIVLVHSCIFYFLMLSIVLDIDMLYIITDCKQSTKYIHKLKKKRYSATQTEIKEVGAKMLKGQVVRLPLELLNYTYILH